MITVEASTLAAAMAHASAIPSARNTIPILSHARLIARDGMLEITTTDMDIQFQTTIPLAQAGELAIAVDAGRITDVAKNAPAGAQMTLTMDGRQLIVKTGRSRYRLPVLAPGDLPDMADKFKGNARIIVPAPALAAMITRTVWSVSSETTRYYLCGILLNGQPGTLTMAATNGHTLVELETDWEWPAGAHDVIVPTKLANLICRLIGKGTGEVQICWSDAMMQLRIGDATLLGKMIDGQFPDYRRIIPPESNVTLIDPEQLRAALRRVAMMVEGKTRIIRMEREAGKVTLSGASEDGADACEEIPAEVEPFPKVGFNAAYMASALEHLGGDTLRIDQQDPASPGLFRRQPADKARVVIMPCRV